MAEYFFDLSQKDRREAVEYVRAESGRPAHLLEKDIWVVWALRALFDAPVAKDLTFKGGTSLSKVYQIINRFSEDIDLTYDIRKLIRTFWEKATAAHVFCAQGRIRGERYARHWHDLVAISRSQSCARPGLRGHGD